MICSHLLSFSTNRIHIRPRIINQMPLITSIDVIASAILEGNLSLVFDRDQDQIIQMNRALHTIGKKITPTER